MLFSIITVTYNAGSVLERTLQSVCSQTYPHIEYMVIDGNSSDRTVAIVKKHEDQIAYWISEPDQGLYDAMNKGLQAATGDYVWFLNAGDVFKNENTVSELAEIAIQNEMPDILYGETDLIDQEGNRIGERRLKAPEHLTWKNFRMGMLVCHQAFVVKRELVPLYNLQYCFSADFDWCIQCMKKAKAIVNTKRVLIDYLQEGLTTVNRKASLKERYAIMCKYYGIFATLMRHIWFAVRFYWAKCFHKDTV